MENRLKKQLAIIKERAKRLRAHRELPDEETNPVIDEVVATGAVVRGRDFVPSGRGSRSVEPLDPLAAFRVGEPVTIEVACPGEERVADGAPCYVVRREGNAVDATAPEESHAFGRLIAWPEGIRPRKYRSGMPIGRYGSAEGLVGERVCFLDIETTGLSPNTYLFLCGLMYLERGRFVMEQVVARDYAEEAGLVGYVRDRLTRFNAIVTYNGARFDLPFIRTRLATHRAGILGAFDSIDLLYTARDVFAEILPNRRLTTVERHLRGVGRTGDIPGRYIPEAYHEFVASGDARAMKNVLYHNRMDIFTMAVMVNRLAEAEPSLLNYAARQRAGEAAGGGIDPAETGPVERA